MTEVHFVDCTKDVCTGDNGIVDSEIVPGSCKQLPSLENQAHPMSCVICCRMPELQPPKVLPCLHLTCGDCLKEFLTTKFSNSIAHEAAIFSCPRCDYKMQLPNGGILELKNAAFLMRMGCQGVDIEESDHKNIEKLLSVPNNAATLPVEYGAICTSVDPINWNITKSGLAAHNLVSHTSSHDDMDCNSCRSVVSNNGLVDSLSLEVVVLEEHLVNEDHKDDSASKTASQVVGHSDTCKAIAFSGSLSSTAAAAVDACKDHENPLALHKLHLQSLVEKVNCQRHNYEQMMRRVESARARLDSTKSALRESVARRADYLCQLIQRRCNDLFNELDHEHISCTAAYGQMTQSLGNELSSLSDCAMFVSALLKSNNADADLYSAASVRLNHLLNTSEARRLDREIPEISDLRVNVPDAGHEESHLEKLFGTLVRGTIGGSAMLLTSFHTELHWPSAFVVTRSHDSVLVGKSGAFANDDGRVLFYDRHGTRVNSRAFGAGRVPVSTVAIANGRVLVSDVGGCISKFSSCGQLLAEWPEMFRGPSGHMTVVVDNVHNDELVLVTSALDHCVHRYRTIDGHCTGTFSLDWNNDQDTCLLEPTCISSNSYGHIIVTVADSPSVYFFNHDGKLLHVCSQLVGHSAAIEDVQLKISVRGDMPTHSFPTTGAVLPVRLPPSGFTANSTLIPTVRCLPSAVCCDPFNNVLVADFMANCIHFISQDGQYLGRLLTKADGIACPNCMSLDQDGRLYIGQYGGDMLVFQYLSCVKHA